MVFFLLHLFDVFILSSFYFPRFLFLLSSLSVYFNLLFFCLFSFSLNPFFPFVLSFLSIYLADFLVPFIFRHPSITFSSSQGDANLVLDVIWLRNTSTFPFERLEFFGVYINSKIEDDRKHGGVQTFALSHKSCQENNDAITTVVYARPGGETVELRQSVKAT